MNSYDEQRKVLVTGPEQNPEAPGSAAYNAADPGCLPIPLPATGETSPDAQNANPEVSTGPADIESIPNAATLRCSRIVFGYDGGQQQVAWTDDLDKPTRDLIHDVIAVGMDLDDDYPESLMWFHLGHDSFVLVIGLRGRDTSGRGFPAYNAFVVSKIDTKEVLANNPFPLYRAILENKLLALEKPADKLISPLEFPASALRLSQELPELKTSLEVLAKMEPGVVVELFNFVFRQDTMGAVVTEWPRQQLLEVMEALVLIYPAELRGDLAFASYRRGAFPPALKFAFERPACRGSLRESRIVTLDLADASRARLPAAESEFGSEAVRLLMSPDGVGRFASLKQFEVSEHNGVFRQWDLANWTDFFSWLNSLEDSINRKNTGEVAYWLGELDRLGLNSALETMQYVSRALELLASFDDRSLPPLEIWRERYSTTSIREALRPDYVQKAIQRCYANETAWAKRNDWLTTLEKIVGPEDFLLRRIRDTIEPRRSGSSRPGISPGIKVSRPPNKPPLPTTPPPIVHRPPPQAQLIADDARPGWWRKIRDRIFPANRSK